MVSQLVLNGFVAASAYALVGLGFGMIYWVARFFHFAHGAVFTYGAYFAWALASYGKIPLIVAIPLAIGMSAIIGSLMELFVYAPLRRRRASSMIALLASFGLYVVLQNIISLMFGDTTKMLRPMDSYQSLEILGGRLTSIQIVTICASIILIITVWIFLSKTKLGRAMRAVANDPELASISGIDCYRVTCWSFILGSTLAGLAGILVGLDIDIVPTMGLNALMMGVVVVIIGGIGSIPGVVLGAVFLGMAQHLGVLKISSQWQDAIAFIILLAFLLFRPQGFMGKSVRKATV